MITKTMDAPILHQSRRQERQGKQPQQDTTQLPINIGDQSPLLQNILKKLRPFQLEAFDFATKGITYNRQWGEGEASTNVSDGSDESTNNARIKSKARSTTTQNKSFKFDYDPALLGKGRILLADEMVRKPTLHAHDVLFGCATYIF